MASANSYPKPSLSADCSQQRIDTFMKQAGRRVLQARQQLGFSRRELSERSGVSQRTIVLLETGAGNISISLLYRLAIALGHSASWFLLDDDQSEQQATQVAEFYRRATPTQRQKVLNFLACTLGNNTKRSRICLIGLRGAGKSTLGALLSDAMSLPFLELNDEIEALSGMSVQELISLYGPEGYRRMESQALTRVVERREQVVLAAAGGIVSESEVYASLLKHFHTVWLKATPAEHMERVRQQGDERPMAGNPQAMQELKSILTSRESLYAMADKSVDTSGSSVEVSLQELLVAARSMLN